jgi:hypothetical protein
MRFLPDPAQTKTSVYINFRNYYFNVVLDLHRGIKRNFSSQTLMALNFRKWDLK